ncbi:MAG: tetratricopeptide repeat protein [Streptosporangiaceae bacterium]
MGVSGQSAADWSDIASIRAEWPQSSLDRVADLQGFRQALALYERDDYASMMRCAQLFATALAHSLYGQRILEGDDLVNTIYQTLFCSLFPPPDGKTFADSARRAARLALTIMRENGLQPPSHGGSLEFFEPTLANGFILLSTAIAPPDQPLNGDLAAFFAVPPSPAVGPLPNPETDRLSDTVNRVHDALQEAEAGDTASSLFMAGLALAAQGDREGALAKQSEAARLGSVQAMAEAAQLARGFGRDEESRFWEQSAAEAGHPSCMYNVGVDVFNSGDTKTAAQWFQRAAEAGHIEGLAALTQLADNADDKAGERYWARLGAEAGQTFCMSRHGLHLVLDAGQDVPTLRRAREFLEQAADRGDVNAMVMAANVNRMLKDPARGQGFVSLVVQSGNTEAIDRLRRYGFL